MELNKEKVDIHSTDSSLTGWKGALETVLRKNKGLGYLIAICLTAFAYTVCLTLSFAPGFAIMETVLSFSSSFNIAFRAVSLGVALTVSIFLFASLLLISIPILNKLVPMKKENWRGTYYSLKVIPWFYHNALVFLARYTFLNFVQSTPIINMFYSAMGMKIGKGCIINTVNIQDPCLIELGDHVTIGGSATVFCHYGQAGFLVIAPVKIGNGATIGLKASIMGDVEIEDHVLIPAHTAILPKSRIKKDK
jgi:hypothetical protein